MRQNAHSNTAGKDRQAIRKGETMKRLLLIIPMVFLCCLTVGCRQGEDVAAVNTDTDIRAAKDTADNPWNGTWKLNADRSKAPGGQIPHPTSTNIIEIQGETMHLVAEHTNTSGKLEKVEYTAKFDGKEYPVQATPPGPQPYTISLKQIDSRTREFVEVIGTFTIEGRDILSEDGRSFDRIVNSKDAAGNDTSVLQVFEKQ